MAQVDLRHATITFTDGAASTVTVKIGEGNLTYTEQRPVQYMTDRGFLDEVRLDKPVPVEVKVDAVWVAVGSSIQVWPAQGRDATRPTPTTETAADVPAFLRGQGGLTSADSDTARPFAVDITVAYPSLAGAGETTTTITLPKFRYESIDFDLSGGTMSFSGKCFAKRAQITEA